MKKILLLLVLAMLVGIGSVSATPITYTTGPLKEADRNRNRVLDPFTFNFTGLSAPSNSPFTMRIDWKYLDLDSTSEFLAAAVINGVTYNLGRMSKVITGIGDSSSSSRAFNVSGYGLLTSDFSSIGGFSGGDLRLRFTPSRSVNAYNGTRTCYTNCTGSAVASLSYDVPEPTSLLLLSLGLAGIGYKTRKAA